MAFNILVVDDSETMRAVIKKIINMTGINIGELLEAANGKEALSLLNETWVDVVLSDINMPEMDGVELLKEIKKDDVLRSIPVIFISTESSHTRKEKAENMGASAYIKKPFQPEVIKEILLDVLNKAYAVRMMEEFDTSAAVGADDLDF